MLSKGPRNKPGRYQGHSHNRTGQLDFKPRTKNPHNRLFTDVADDLLLEIELMGLALATGIMDATTFPDYHVFASNQTGNTALLAVGALRIGGDTINLSNIGISLGLFVGAGVIFGQVGNRIGPSRRIWLLVTNAVQTILVAVAAGLRWKVATSSNGPGALGIIALLAFASGAQVALARTVNVPEISTAMVTSAYIDFFADPRLFQAKNRSRNRRFFFVISLLLGSFIGAIAYRYVGPALSLLLSAICKLVVTISFFANSEAI